jgi:lipoyl(octanoyl) transferase
VREAHLGVTSLKELGATADMRAVDAALRKNIELIFGPTAGA